MASIATGNPADSYHLHALYATQSCGYISLHYFPPIYFNHLARALSKFTLHK
jgi:hypothetical protein